MPPKKKTARKPDDADDKKVLAVSKEAEKQTRSSARNKSAPSKPVANIKAAVTKPQKGTKAVTKEVKKPDIKKKGTAKTSKKDIQNEESSDEEGEEEEEEKTTSKSKSKDKKANAKGGKSKSPVKSKTPEKGQKKGKAASGKVKKDMIDESEEHSDEEKEEKEETKVEDKGNKRKVVGKERGGKDDMKEEKGEEKHKGGKTKNTKGPKGKKDSKADDDASEKEDEKEIKDEQDDNEAKKLIGEEVKEEISKAKVGKEKKKGGKKSNAKSATKDDEEEEGKDSADGTVVGELKRQATGNFSLGDGVISSNKIKISSWNVNGLRAAIGKGHLAEYLKSHNLDMICFNETKVDSDKLNDPAIIKTFPSEYHLYFNCCKGKKGYSGTGIATKHKPLAVYMDIGIPKHDIEGRTITLEFEHFFLISCYVPNAGQGLDRLDYRTKEWDIDFRNFMIGLKKKKHVIWCGDLNVAHQEIDIYDPKGNRNKTAGFTDREREEFTNLLNEGFADSFRELHPTEVKYSWWSVRSGSRKVNKGWRLDYFVVDKEGMKAVEDSIVNNNIEGSDHCPIELIFNPNFS